MRNKSLFLLLACVCGTVAAIGVSQWMQANNASGEGSTVEIFVAGAAIDIGEEITAEKIRLEPWPTDRIPEGSTSDLDSLMGMYAKQRFFEGEPVMPVKLTADDHTVIPKGYSVVSMKADTGSSIANLVQPGDRVNVMAYFTKSDLIPQSMTKTVLVGVRIFAIDGDTERKIGEDRPKQVRTIQLLIHKNDAEAWTYAQELGKIRLSLGNDSDFENGINENGENAAGQEFLKWLADHRAAQEALREAKREEEKPEAVLAPAPVKKKDGFTMFKMHEGKMTEYYIELGKLPVIVGSTGPEETTESSDMADSDPQSQAPPPAGTDDDEDYSYLNGSDSPFYQPPGRSRSGTDGY